MWACKYLFEKGVIYFFPSDTDVRDFSHGRVKEIIKYNEAINEAVEDVDNVNLKKVSNAFLYFRGMRSSIKMKSVPADMIIVDELDEADPNAIDMARERMADSKHKWELYLSNPTIPDYGIDTYFQQSDQLHWLIKCVHCNAWNMEDLKNDFLDNLKPNANTGLIELVCKKCGKPIDRNSGEWVAKYPDITDWRGYHFSQLMNPNTDLTEFLNLYYKSLKAGKLQNFYNLKLGFSHVSAREKLEKEKILKLCSLDFPNRFDEEYQNYIGVDQGKDLHVVILHKKEDIIYCEFFMLKDFEELDTMVAQSRKTVIDALPETRKARELADRNKGKVYLNFYVESQKGKPKWNEKDFTVNENRTESLDSSHAMLAQGQVILPPQNETVEEFAEQCSNVAKKLEEDPKTGSKRYVWLKTGADHYRHAFNYAVIAMEGEDGEPNVYLI